MLNTSEAEEIVILRQDINKMKMVLVAMNQQHKKDIRYIYFLIIALIIFCVLTFFGLYRLNESLKGDHTEWKKETTFQV